MADRKPGPNRRGRRSRARHPRGAATGRAAAETRGVSGPRGPRGVAAARELLLVRYLAMARYASEDQVRRLLGSEAQPRSLRRWLTPHGDLSRAGLFRRLEYRRRDGAGVAVFTLARRGEELAAGLGAGSRHPPSRRVGHAFLEHALLLNEVLLDLLGFVARPGDPLPGSLPFDWRSEGKSALEFRAFQRHLGITAAVSIRPDAVLAIPSRRRRIFLEAETGTQSIAGERADRGGSVLAKVDRYASYVLGASGRGLATWYLRDFPDGYAPRLAFLVRSAERRDRVRTAVEGRLGAIAPSRFRVAVLTFAEAGAALANYLSSGRQAGPWHARRGEVELDAGLARRVERACAALGGALTAALRAPRRSGSATHVRLPTGLQGEALVLKRFFEELWGAGAPE